MVIDGVMLLWFTLTALSVGFVAIDIRTTPESVVLKWGFILLTAYTGPIGAFLYVLGCREPLPGLHERYVSATWRQVLGSTMHCVAGDGVGILVGAALGSVLALSRGADIALEYALGFAFGWTVFQALFMKGMAGTYRRSLETTFYPEVASMNILMAATVLTRTILQQHISGADETSNPEFWWVLSMALMAGFVFAYPMNWWLVTRNLKHGMTTVRHADDPYEGQVLLTADQPGKGHRPGKPSTEAIVAVGAFSVAALVTSLIVSTAIA